MCIWFKVVSLHGWVDSIYRGLLPPPAPKRSLASHTTCIPFQGQTSTCLEMKAKSVNQVLSYDCRPSIGGAWSVDTLQACHLGRKIYRAFQHACRVCGSRYMFRVISKSLAASSISSKAVFSRPRSCISKVRPHLVAAAPVLPSGTQKRMSTME